MPRADDHARKLHRWLRVVRNGDQLVNALRSDVYVRMAWPRSKTQGLETVPMYAQMAQQGASTTLNI